MKYTILAVILAVIYSCQTSFEEPIISLDAYQIEPGFELEMVASEPLLKAPVAIDFDSKGRIWVAQMPGYMNDIRGSGEEEPTGNIKILEDLDHDGVADHAKVFLDSLVMTRALALVYGGLLYAEPPFLYFVAIENDKPKKRIVVDSVYAAEGNPEHQPNGLVLNIDNWIYNAKSNFRYQRKNGVWIKEPTTFRGQWGISHDNFGRLYYNNNSQQLLGDYVLPNRLVRNKNFTPIAGVNRKLTTDQRVYPIHETDVNRGYAPGVLNADSVLVNTTAAAGLVVYRGGSFSEDYDENVFVSIPEGNLIKRNILTFTADSTIANQAWQNKEFLASTDEGFRPVTLKNGPDGAMYIVDMHRGMIGHHAYLSPYLRKRNEVSRLDTLVDFGRILKVKRATKRVEAIPDFNALNDVELVRFLKHKNGWVRDRAQHLLIFKGMHDVLPELKAMALNTKNSLAQMHALYALDGLDALDFDLLVKVSKKSTAEVISHALVLSEQFVSEENSKKAERLFEGLIVKDNATIDLYLASTLGKWIALDDSFFGIMITVFSKHKSSPVFQESVLSGLEGQEISFAKLLNELSAIDSDLKSKLKTAISNHKEEIVNPIFSLKSLNEDNRTAGAKMFSQICASCHGSNGEGINGLAPPLMKSEYVADTESLGLIILHGLQGPVTVKGKSYNFNLAMPGLIRNESISDQDIQGLIEYVTNAFSDIPKSINVEKVSELRTLIPESGTEYTEKELLERGKKPADVSSSL